MTLPELFEKVGAKWPAVRPKIGAGTLEYLPSHYGGFWMGGMGGVCDDTAEAIIEAACWRVLPRLRWEQSEDDRYWIVDPNCQSVASAWTLTEALLLAVEQLP